MVYMVCVVYMVYVLPRIIACAVSLTCATLLMYAHFPFDPPLNQDTSALRYALNLTYTCIGYSIHTCAANSRMFGQFDKDCVCELEEFASKRDLVNYCNIVLIGPHYSSTAERPTGGGDTTTAIAIAVVSVLILVAVVIASILVVCLCRKIRVQGDYDTGSSEHVCEVYLCILCAVFVL